MKFEAHIEKRLPCDYVHSENWGTPDAFVYNKDAKVLHILDYKYGFSYVEEFENWQCINYAIAVASYLKIAFNSETTVRITIVQPRHYGRHGPVRSWDFPISKLTEYGAALHGAATMAMLDEAPCVTGDQCKHCSGRHACEALQRDATLVTDQAYSNLPLELTPQQAGRELEAMTRAAKLLESRVTGLTEQLLAAARGGASIPGWAIERAEGRQKWIKSVPEVIALGQLMGIDVSKLGVITPKQAVAKGLLAAVVAGASEVPLGEWKLVRVDPRVARKAFGS